MPLVIPAGFGELTFVFEATGDPEPMTFAFGVANVDDVTELTDAVEAWSEAWGITDSMNTALSSSFVLARVEGRTDPDGSNLAVDVPVNTAGDGGPESMVSNCAVLIRKVTASGGRRKRGRFYIPGVLAPDQIGNNGGIDGVAFGALQDAINVWWLAGNASGHTMQLLHSDQVRDPDLPPPAMIPNPDPTPTPITALVLDPVIATQRRRLR